MWRHFPYTDVICIFPNKEITGSDLNVLFLHWRSYSFQNGMRRRNRIKVSIPANNDFKRQKSPRIATTMNCRSAPLRGIATTHNPHTTQNITDRNYRKIIDRRHHICDKLSLPGGDNI